MGVICLHHGCGEDVGPLLCLTSRRDIRFKIAPLPFKAQRAESFVSIVETHRFVVSQLAL